MSASDVLMGYLCHATERIHIGSGIFNPLPAVNHPAKVAERVAMLDHISGHRFEFGTGRGAGSHEILGFLEGIADMSETKAIWEDVIQQIPKMWLQETFEGYQSTYWSLPPRMVLPKPWGPTHPAMWYAAGNQSSWTMAARKGLGILGFAIASLEEATRAVSKYRKAIAEAEPVGAFVNDNVMVTTPASVSLDRKEAESNACDPNMAYTLGLLYRYHDTFPRPQGVPEWPALPPHITADAVPAMREAGAIVGDPEDALRVCQRWEETGVDQLGIPLSSTATKEFNLEVIRLMGEHVIPHLDKDPVHRTTRYRDAAAAIPATSVSAGS
jgi:alkanesulfonate monooxygenase SsuD/methylene tetrahydromethanopterin reductase-like flavin-dependent oxidoreductase (luciferase family)